MKSDLEEEDFGAMLAAFESEQANEPRPEPKIGDKVTGKIVALGDEVAFVDLGGKSEGLVQHAELTDDDGRWNAAVGDSVTGVVRGVDESGAFLLRVRAGAGETLRSELRIAFEQKIPVEGRVSAVVKGGLEVTVGGLRAFCPISQISDSYVENAEEFVGERFEFRIERFEEAGRRTNLVVSRRALLKEAAARRADELRQYLEVGATLEGTVSSVTSYGAFVDLGGLEGLLHVSEMSYQRVEDPHEIVSEGQRLEVRITAIEPPKKPGQTERISLSIRALERNPWDDVERRFPLETIVEGRVTRLESYGAFVEIAPGLEGLVHVSQLGGEERVRHPRDVVELGATVQVKVLSVDLEKRRISLTRETGEKEREEKREYQEYKGKEAASGGFGSGSFGSLGDFFKKKE